MTANEKNFLYLSTVQERENPDVSFSLIVILAKNLRNLTRRSLNLPIFISFVRDPIEPHPNQFVFHSEYEYALTYPLDTIPSLSFEL